MMSAGFDQVIVGVAFDTVKDALPLAAAKPLSPAKLAPTPVGYVPALMPERLAPARLATPLAFVVALPTELPLRVNATVLPLTPEPPDVSVAERFAVPPYVPLAELTERLAAACAL